MTEDNSHSIEQVGAMLKGMSIDHEPKYPSDDFRQEETLMIRALVSSKEAGVIIGKGGKNVTDIRDSTGARAGVSKVVQGVPTRVLSITGSLEAVASAFGKVARSLIDSIDASPEASTNLKAGTNTASMRVLIANNIMGSIIGKQGTKIKQIQEVSGSRMIATKEMLAHSTERVVEIQGNPESITLAVQEIGRAIMHDWEKTQGTILYNPTQRAPALMSGTTFYPTFQNNYPHPHNGEFNYHRGTGRFDNHHPHPHVQPHINPAIQHSAHLTQPIHPIGQTPQIPGAPLLTKKLSIASDLVGCVIGKQGTKIAEIRRLSNAKISIAKEPENETNTRLFTLYGTPEANDTAVYLIYAQLEAEKERRAQSNAPSHHGSNLPEKSIDSNHP